MAVIKMKLVNVVGPLDKFEHVVNDYILDKEINLENAMEVLESTKGQYPFTVNNEYRAAKATFENFFSVIGTEKPKFDLKAKTFKKEEIDSMIELVSSKLADTRSRVEKIDTKLKEDQELLDSLDNIMEVDIPLSRLFSLEYMKFRFGKLPKAGYQTLETYLEDLETFFIPTREDRDYIWGMYFTPDVEEEKIDSLFSSLYFKRIRLSDQLALSPQEEYNRIKNEISSLHDQRKAIESEAQESVKKECDTIYDMYRFVMRYEFIDRIKSYCAHTKESFHLVGWMAPKDMAVLEKQLEQEKDVMIISEKPEEAKTKPPTLIKNWAIFRPFETLIRMYGLPDYSEIDPTMFVAITYFIMFGIMFGDVGQGLVLSIAGFLFYHFKKNDLGAVAGMVGISSIGFGFVYGSFFGNEDILPFHVLKPMDSINQLLICSVVFGVLLILICMAFNIINGIKNKDLGKVFVGQNSLAGMIFYVAVLLIVLKMFTGKGLTASPIVILLFIAAPLIVIMLQEPLSKLLAKCKDYKPEEPGMFIVESFFELFEIVLSFVTNTLSFLRVGAFAMNHAGMMMVVYSLADMAGHAGSIPVLIIGNIFVMCMEGFIVAIQILRLEFYEMFSRFFSGDGIEFKSIKAQIDQQQ